jgi:hypothetical protein
VAPDPGSGDDPAPDLRADGVGMEIEQDRCTLKGENGPLSGVHDMSGGFGMSDRRFEIRGAFGGIAFPAHDRAIHGIRALGGVRNLLHFSD